MSSFLPFFLVVRAVNSAGPIISEPGTGYDLWTKEKERLLKVCISLLGRNVFVQDLWNNNLCVLYLGSKQSVFWARGISKIVQNFTAGRAREQAPHDSHLPHTPPRGFRCFVWLCHVIDAVSWLVVVCLDWENSKESVILCGEWYLQSRPRSWAVWHSYLLKLHTPFSQWSIFQWNGRREEPRGKYRRTFANCTVP